jgi:hypothetical protein
MGWTGSSLQSTTKSIHSGSSAAISVEHHNIFAHALGREVEEKSRGDCGELVVGHETVLVGGIDEAERYEAEAVSPHA